MQMTALKMEVPSTPSPLALANGIICAPDSPLVDVVRACARVAASDATVLLTGETGTGKEVFARMVHTHSVRSKRPFVPVNCAAIPEALLESELFGYVRGAFTGAVSSRRGRVGMAESGTLFLDEVGDLPLSLQVKLLRLLQHRTYEPVGSSESITGDFRLVTATNRDLAEDVRTGRFRRDLYYRLHVCPLVLPPLRERKMDIAPLFFHFWHKHGETRSIAPAALRQLESYPWPGNVRELENLAERLSVCSESSTIAAADLPSSFLGDVVDCLALPSVLLSNSLPDDTMATLDSPAESAPRIETGEIDLDPIPTALAAEVFREPSSKELTMPTPGADFSSLSTELRLPIDLPRLLRETEDAFIRRALTESRGNKKEAARLLGMGRTTLVEKLRRKAAVAEEKLTSQE